MAALGVSKYHGIISPSYHIYEQITPHAFLDDFLDLLLRSNLFKKLYKINSSGITTSRLRLYPEDFLNIKFLCPPLDEQKYIVNRLNDSIRDIDISIGKAQREIALIHEDRARFISDVVTGKVDVRHLDLEPGGKDLEKTVEELEPIDHEAGELDEETFAGQVDL